jgi:RNA polymerase sigma factor (TIGR02999 family)
MRNVLVDYAREQSAEKRGRDVPFVPLELADGETADHVLDLRVDWLAVHAALDALEAFNAHSARIVELKFFSGLTLEEIADTVEVSRATVIRDWRFARAWLGERLGVDATRGRSA